MICLEGLANDESAAHHIFKRLYNELKLICSTLLLWFTHSVSSGCDCCHHELQMKDNFFLWLPDE